MVVYYFDTSAMLKWYLNETGSAWLRQLLATTQPPVIVTSQLLVVEMISAFNRRVREGGVTRHDYDRLTDRLRDDCRDVCQLFALDYPLINLAWSLLERHPLRALDAAHLATALFVNQQLTQAGAAPLVFLSADNRLNDAASAEGLSVDNPNHHP